MLLNFFYFSPPFIFSLHCLDSISEHAWVELSNRCKEVVCFTNQQLISLLFKLVAKNSCLKCVKSLPQAASARGPENVHNNGSSQVNGKYSLIILFWGVFECCA